MFGTVIIDAYRKEEALEMLSMIYVLRQITTVGLRQEFIVFGITMRKQFSILD